MEKNSLFFSWQKETAEYLTLFNHESIKKEIPDLF